MIRVYKLSGRPAAYYLLPKGLRALKQYTNRDDITDAAIKNSYKDKDELVSEQFIDHNLDVYAISNRLQALYPAIKQFTKRELVIYNYFPKQLPDLYLSIEAWRSNKAAVSGLYRSQYTVICDYCRVKLACGGRANGGDCAPTVSQGIVTPAVVQA